MSSPNPARDVLYVALLATAYASSGALGLSLASFGDQVTLLWAPTGLSIGALVVGGRRLTPGVFLGALAVNLWTGAPWWSALLIAGGNTLEALFAATLLERLAFRRSLERLRDVTWFLVVAVLGSPVVAASVGALALVLSGVARATDAPDVWLLWWLGDGTGALVVAPMLLTWDSQLLKDTLGRTVALVAALALTTALAFGTIGPHTHPLSIAPFMLVFAAALRLGVPIASMLITLTGAGAVLGAVLNTGPFMHDGTLDLSQTWAYLALLGSSTLVAASLVAERQAADAARLQVEASAIEAQRLEGLGLIAAGIAHDFNNLLQVIQGHSALARHEPMRTHLDQIDASVDKAAQLCDQLLTYAGEARQEVEPMELGAELTAIEGLIRATMPAGVELSLDEGSEVVVRCDRGQLHRAVLNLLNNAAEASGERGHIVLRFGRDPLTTNRLQDCAVAGPETAAGDFGWLEVQDRGEGMTPEVSARLFEPFFTTRFHGRGLGLASVAGVARTHGGAIEVDSQVGEGTRIRLWLPTTSEQPVAAVPEEPTTQSDAPVRVLLVDDDDNVRMVGRLGLVHGGFEVVEVASGHAALEQCDDPAIRVVVLDYTMHDMDGGTTARRLKERRPDLPIVMCSGLNAEQALGVADAFLQKPYRPSELQKVIAELLPC